MREILFRGKKISDNKWVCGSLVDFGKIDDGSAHKIGIVETDNPDGIYNDVLPDTVGQYTGLTDKNGEKIFECDILEGFMDNTVYYVTVVWRNLGWCAEQKNCLPDKLEECDGKRFEIISNIYDNSELLEGSDESEW